MTTRSRLLAILATGISVAVLAATPASAADQNLAARWKMNEGPNAQIMRDSSGHANNGTIINVATGKVTRHTRAYRFVKPSIVQVPSSSTLNPGGRRVSFAAMVKSAGPAADWNVMQKGFSTTPGGYYKMEIRPTHRKAGGRASCTFRGSHGVATLIAGPNVVDNKWHQIACAKTGKLIKLVVDGQSFTKTADIGYITNTVPLSIGAKTLSQDQYIGYINSVSVWIG